MAAWVPVVASDLPSLHDTLIHWEKGNGVLMGLGDVITFSDHICNLNDLIEKLSTHAEQAIASHI